MWKGVHELVQQMQQRQQQPTSLTTSQRSWQKRQGVGQYVSVTQRLLPSGKGEERERRERSPPRPPPYSSTSWTCSSGVPVSIQVPAPTTVLPSSLQIWPSTSSSNRLPAPANLCPWTTGAQPSLDPPWCPAPSTPPWSPPLSAPPL